MYRLLLIDDNPDDRTLIIYELEREFSDLDIEQVIEAEGFNKALTKGNFDLAITDYRLGWNDGLTVLHEIKKRYPKCPVIMFTDSGSQEIAVEAMKGGLDDYIIKSPKHFMRLPGAIRSALQRAESQQRVALLEMRLQSLLNRLDVGVFRSTLDGELLEGNASFVSLWGVNSLEEAQTLYFTQLFQPEELARSDWHQKSEVQLQRGDGRSLWVLVTQTLGTEEGEPVIEGLIEDISDRKQAELEREQAIAREQEYQLIRSSEERYRQMVELCPDAIFIQSEGQIVFVNSATVKLYGATRSQELIGKRVLDRVHPDYRLIVQQRMQQLLEGQQAELMEQKWLRLDGTIMDVEVAAIPFTYQNQPVAQVVFRDISTRKQSEREVLKALAQERELSEIKSRIITTISHEYRTPLTTIIMSVELLKNYAYKLTQEKQLAHLNRISDSAHHLSDLVNDVLAIFKAEAGKVQFNPAPLDLEQFCREMVEEMNLSIRGSGRPHITFFSRGNCGDACLDEKLLRQILTNLLSNAIKYSPQGDIVRFDLECIDGHATIRIQDEGIGIPSADLARLFESFYRASNVGTLPGTGLGLTIVKKCVDLHGGQIGVESVLDIGTTVTVMLPVQGSRVIPNSG